MVTDYIRFAGTEVINTERLEAYIANGIRPAGGTTFDVPTCEGLSAVLYPDGVFTTPLGDEAPWYDANDSDTWDFAGVLPLAVTGLDGTTRTVEMVPTVKGNGLPGRAIRGPQTVAVSALLVGRTSEGVRAGLAWLRRVLHGDCDSSEQPCGPSGVLETFTVCPGPITPAPDLNNPISVTQNHPNAAVDPSTDWVVLNGEFTEDAAPGTFLVPFDLADYIDANGPVPLPDEIDGGGPLPLPDVIDGGGFGVVGQVTLGAAAQACTAGPVTITWTLSATPETVASVQLVILDAANQVAITGPTYIIPMVDQEWEWELPVGVDVDMWRPAIIATQTIEVTDVTVSSFGLLDPVDCIAPYRRFFPVTATIDGPNELDTIDTECAELLRVEWTWQSGSPYRYGPRDPVLLALGWGEEPTLVAPGVTYDAGDPPTLVDATPWNCAPPVPAVPCAIDPASPSFGTPPAYPVITDTLRPRITTQDVRDYWAVVGPELVPANEGVFTIDLTAGAEPVVGVRVRVWDDADADGTVPDLCDFAYEFLIDYIPANGVLTIDGAAGTITTICDGDPAPQDASAGVRGAYGGPVEDPVIRCDRRYLVRVQWLDEYPRTAAPFYTIGDPEGSLSMNLYVTTREG